MNTSRNAACRAKTKPAPHARECRRGEEDQAARRSRGPARTVMDRPCRSSTRHSATRAPRPAHAGRTRASAPGQIVTFMDDALQLTFRWALNARAARMYYGVGFSVVGLR